MRSPENKYHKKNLRIQRLKNKRKSKFKKERRRSTLKRQNKSKKKNLNNLKNYPNQQRKPLMIKIKDKKLQVKQVKSKFKSQRRGIKKFLIKKLKMEKKQSFQRSINLDQQH